MWTSASSNFKLILSLFREAKTHKLVLKHLYFYLKQCLGADVGRPDAQVFFFKLESAQHSWRGAGFNVGFAQTCGFGLLSRSFCAVFVFEALFDFHSRSDLLHTPKARPPRCPAAPQFLCGLIRLIEPVPPPKQLRPWGLWRGQKLPLRIYLLLTQQLEDKPRPARWASLRGLSAAPERLQLPACFHLHFHHSYQAHSTTDRADTGKAKA